LSSRAKKTSGYSLFFVPKNYDFKAVESTRKPYKAANAKNLEAGYNILKWGPFISVRLSGIANEKIN
jgi:hypothetical protein